MSAAHLVRRLLRTPERKGVRAQLFFWVCQRVLRINSQASWPVHPLSRVVSAHRVRLGKASYPGDMPSCYIQAMNGIEIGEGCEFGPGVGLISANHNLRDLTQHADAPPIRIGDHSWIGMHAIILPGVQLGPHTIVGAGAVVTQSFPEGHQVLAGNPAKVVRRLKD